MKSSTALLFLLVPSGVALSQPAQEPVRPARSAPAAEADKGDYWSREQIARRAEGRMKALIKALEAAAGKARSSLGRI